MTVKKFIILGVTQRRKKKKRLFPSCIKIIYRIDSIGCYNEMLNAQQGCGCSVKNDRIKLSWQVSRACRIISDRIVMS